MTEIQHNIDLVQDQLQNFRSRLENDTYLLYELQIDHLSDRLAKAAIQLLSLEPNRQKRGLIDGLGSVIKSITGNLDYKDAIKYDEIIRSLQNNQDKITSEVNDHISISKEWMSRHSDILSQIVDNQNKINETIELLLDKDVYVESSLIKYAKLAQLFSIVSENIDDLMEELIRIENVLAFIRSSSVHHSIIGVDALAKMIDKLKDIYNEDRVLNLELREYYDLIKPGSYYAQKRIVIILRVPIVSPDTYQLYKLIPLPNKNLQAIIPPHSFIATNELYSMYIEAECPKVSQTYLCEEDNNHLQRNPDCISQLINGRPSDDTCHIVTITLEKEAMKKLDDQRYALVFPHPADARLICAHEEHVTLQGSYLASIPHKCSIRTKELTIVNSDDYVSGQPLKIMKTPTNEEKISTSPLHFKLNSMNLDDLRRIQDRVSLQPRLEIDHPLQAGTLYHTTVPFYTITILITVVTAVAFVSRRCKLWNKLRTTNAQTQGIDIPGNFDMQSPVPVTRSSPTYINAQMHRKDTLGDAEVPATFSHKVLE